ncbi:cupin domain-containing protein [Coralliovum pocilloporae]|uniref:cupin domain-containing protein n=1 Tax=Coralliovum pocilloporae TaxID=3066369 RepID=UPI003306D144
MPNRSSDIVGAELVVPCSDLGKTLGFFTKTLGFRLDMIFPADDPRIAVISGHGTCLRLERDGTGPTGTLRLLVSDPDNFAEGQTVLHAPNGMRIELVDANPPLIMPETRHGFHVRHIKDSAPWVIGRAGMHYRDLVPDRLGGSLIASHIRIPDGGPVPDMVHYHTVGFQVIYCYRGWVRLVYEDQGEPFILKAGDCVLQPPEIRHRVLEASDELQVVELGCPAEHITTIDHDMELPTGRLDPEKDFSGQIFCRHQAETAEWAPWRIPGFETRDTGIGRATRGTASVQVIRPSAGVAESPVTSHNTDILFAFILEGQMTLRGEGQTPQTLEPGDAFVIPPDTKTRLCACSDDLQFLEASLPANFETSLYEEQEL